MSIILTLTLIQWLSAGFHQSFFYHRVASHDLCTMSKAWQRFFFITTWISLGPGYMKAWVYGVMHRLHHRHSDTPEDPHPTDKGFLFMMIRMAKINIAIQNGSKQLDEGLTKNLPRWDAFEAVAASYITRIWWVLMYITIYKQCATVAWLWLLLPINVFVGPIQGACINWLGHKIGERTHNTPDTSTNILPIDLVFAGEAEHNNHHAKPNSPRFGTFDTTFFIMFYVLRPLGIITLRERALRELEGKIWKEAAILELVKTPNPK